MANPENREDPLTREEEMATGGPAKNPKKANLLDPHSIKHLLDESVTEVRSLPPSPLSIVRVLLDLFAAGAP